MGAFTPDILLDQLPPGWLPLSHADAARRVPGIEIVSFCDTDINRAKEAACRFGVQSYYSDLDEMLHMEKIDILSIATRTSGRCEAIKKSLLYNVKGIHAEKPLCRSLDECNSTLTDVIKNDVKFTFGTIRRFHNAYKQAKSLIDSGIIGKIEQITIEFGYGQLLWTHPHSFDLALMFSNCRDFEYVQATLSHPHAAWDGYQLDADPRIENAFIKFANGVNAVITRGHGLHVHVGGPDGTISVLSDGTLIEWRRKSHNDSVYPTEKVEIVPTVGYSGTEQALRDLAFAVQGIERSSMNIEDVRSGTQLMFSVAWSSLHGGRRVSVDEVPGSFVVTGRSGDLFA